MGLKRNSIARNNDERLMTYQARAQSTIPRNAAIKRWNLVIVSAPVDELSQRSAARMYAQTGP